VRKERKRKRNENNVSAPECPLPRMAMSSPSLLLPSCWWQASALIKLKAKDGVHGRKLWWL
jgi:hypothetical protein